MRLPIGRDGKYVKTNIKEFLSKLSQEVKVKIPGEAVKAIRAITHELVQDINQIDWFLTGRWRGSTNISINDPNYSLPGTTFSPPTAAQVDAGLVGLKPGDSAKVTLPQPYTRRLETGWSDKAPAFSVWDSVERAAHNARTSRS